MWGTDLMQHACSPGKLQPALVVGSDITYDPGQFQPLLQTIAAYINYDSCVKVTKPVVGKLHL